MSERVCCEQTDHPNPDLDVLARTDPNGAWQAIIALFSCTNALRLRHQKIISHYKIELFASMVRFLRLQSCTPGLLCRRAGARTLPVRFKGESVPAAVQAPVDILAMFRCLKSGRKRR